ncbi:MAG: penicillin-binding protein 2 [Parvularculaceae bacterium]|nr:penicillin-binding protein 2 [Parvularculaceae bacterium]
MLLFRKRTKPRARCIVIEETATAGPDAPPAARVGSRSGARARKRVAMCAVAFIAAYAALAGRLAVVSFGGEKAAAGSTAVAVAADRPEIVDRNGILLATNLPVIALEIAGADVWDAEETAASLGRILPDLDEAALAAKLKDRRYVEAAADLTPAQQEAVFALGLPGVRFSPRVRRFYPQGALAAHVVGHTEAGRGGVMGLERALEDQGSLSPLAAALDLRVQQALEEELAAAAAEHGAEAAFGAVMDVDSGEIVALASLPDFDPNAPGAAPADHRRNRAVYDRYELGSAFKAFTAAAALEAGVAQESSTYDARGRLKVADRWIDDFHGENRVLTFSEVLQHSSNIGAARMAADLGAERQRATLSALGLLDPLPIELHERRAPEQPRKWGPVENATISFGHGISVTPLHLLAAYAAVVNGGVNRPPTFLRRDAPVEGRRVFSERVSAVMRRALRRVVTDGTASKAEAAGYFPIGKTATADKVAAGGYDTGSRIATFVGAFPGYAPRYAVLITLDNPKPSLKTFGYATAGWNAAPAFSRFTARAAPLLGVAPVSEATALAGFYRGYASASAAAEQGGAP